MKVLVVDDSLTMRKILVKLLASMGYENVVQAVDGQDAVEKCEQNPDIELILCDWNMPEKTGIEFLKEFRADEKNKGVPFVMVTTEAEKTAIVQAIQAGANNYVLKPFDQATLKEKVKQTLQKFGKIS